MLHAAEQLSPCNTTTKPVLQSPWDATAELGTATAELRAATAELGTATTKLRAATTEARVP